MAARSLRIAPLLTPGFIPPPFAAPYLEPLQYQLDASRGWIILPLKKSICFAVIALDHYLPVFILGKFFWLCVFPKTHR